MVAFSSRADLRSRPNGFSTTNRPEREHPESARCRISTGNMLGGIAR